MSDSLRLHGLQHARLPCPSPTPGVYSNSCPFSQCCHPTISSSVIPFSSCLQSFPALGPFQWVSSSHQVAKVLELQLQHQSYQWTFRTDFLYNWLVWSPCGPKDSRVFSNITVQRHQFFSTQLSLWSNSHPYMTGETIVLTRQTFVIKVMSLLFNMLSRLVIAFLPRSKHLSIISWLQSPSAVILEPKKIRSVTVSIISPTFCCEVMGLNAMILVFESWVLSQLFHSPLSLSSRSSLVLCFLP